MRHANTVKKLGRTHAHRQATMAALSSALIRHKRIETTLAKAKALRGWVEPILHRAKTDSTHSRRLAFRDLGSDKEAVKVLFGEISSAIGDRPGGYTRVVKLGQRAGDAAEMAVIELVDFNDVRPDGAASGKRKTRRSRRSGKGAADAPAAEATAEKAPAAKATPAAKTGPDDFTRLRGIGPVMAEALHAAGLTTFNQLAKAELQTLRDAIEEHTQVVEENANEETWSAQAELAAAGDWDGLEALIARLDAGEGVHGDEGDEGDEGIQGDEGQGDEGIPGDEGIEGDASAQIDEVAVQDEPAPEDAIAEASDIPTDEPEPGDALPGNAGEGEPPPESDAETRGRAEDRG